MSHKLSAQTTQYLFTDSHIDHLKTSKLRPLRAAVLALSIPIVSEAEVFVFDQNDFGVAVVTPDIVILDCDPDTGGIRVTSENVTTTYLTRCESASTVTIDASSVTNGSVTIDAGALRSGIGSTATATISITGTNFNDTLIGPTNTAATMTIDIRAAGGDNTITIGAPDAAPADVNTGTVTITTGAGNDNISVYRRAQFPEATMANVEIDTGDGQNMVLVISDNVNVTGGTDTDDVTICGCWAGAETGLGADVIALTGFNNSGNGGGGGDQLNVNSTCAAGSQFVIAPPSAEATVTIDAGQGNDQLNVDAGNTASVTISIVDSGPTTDTDTLTVMLPSRSDDATLTIDAASLTVEISNENGNSNLNATQIESITLLTGDETDTGDNISLLVNSAPGASITLDGGLPDNNAQPGDSLLIDDGGEAAATATITILGFETLSSANAMQIPTLGAAGLVALFALMTKLAYRNRQEDVE